jgi:TRAP-type C4-dicarboxylate transport system permease small subunit
VKLFDRIVQAFGCLLLAALLVCVLLGIVTRGLGSPLIWTDEAARMLMVWLASTGWILASRKHAHVRVRFFQDLLPQSAWSIAETVIQLLVAVLGFAVAWFGVVLVRKNLDLDATSLPLSMAWLYMPIVPAGLIIAVQAVVDAIKRPHPMGPQIAAANIAAAKIAGASVE